MGVYIYILIYPSSFLKNHSCSINSLWVNGYQFGEERDDKWAKGWAGGNFCVCAVVSDSLIYRDNSFIPPPLLPLPPPSLRALLCDSIIVVYRGLADVISQCSWLFPHCHYVQFRTGIKRCRGRDSRESLDPHSLALKTSFLFSFPPTRPLYRPTTCLFIHWDFCSSF